MQRQEVRRGRQRGGQAGRRIDFGAEQIKGACRETLLGHFVNAH